jgi:hypothetical protein
MKRVRTLFPGFGFSADRRRNLRVFPDGGNESPLIAEDNFRRIKNTVFEEIKETSPLSGFAKIEKIKKVCG